MKKTMLFLIGFVLLCNSAHATMTDKEIARSLKSLYEDQKSLNELGKQRQAEERALIVEYKVDECNQKRTEMVQRYQVQMQTIQKKMQETQDALGNK